MSVTKILLVEDDPEIAELLSCNISELGDVELCIENDGTKGLQTALDGDFDLILLDIMLPGLHGTEICKRVRESNDSVPIVLLTARNSELDKVLGLEIGADDYVTKPFVIEELFARIRALLRRSAYNKDSLSASDRLTSKLEFAELIIDLEKREVLLGDARLELTPIEYDLLVVFAANSGLAFSRDELLSQTWGATEAGNESIVNSHVNRLRKKLNAQDEQRFIKTIWGVGYRFTKVEELG